MRGDLARLARGVRGVDVWLGGHSHNHVAGEVSGVPALIAGSHGQQIAVCDLVVDPVRDRVVEHRFRLVPTYADEVQPDSAMRSAIERWNSSVASIAAQPVGRNLRRLTRTRGGESTVGNLVTDAMRASAGVEIAMQNTGGLRAELAEGPVTKGAIYEVMPFENTICDHGADRRGGTPSAGRGSPLRAHHTGERDPLRVRSRPPSFQRVVARHESGWNPVRRIASLSRGVNNFHGDGGDDYSVLSRARLEGHADAVTRDVGSVRAREVGEGSGARLPPGGKNHSPAGKPAPQTTGLSSSATPILRTANRRLGPRVSLPGAEWPMPARWKNSFTPPRAGARSGAGSRTLSSGTSTGLLMNAVSTRHRRELHRLQHHETGRLTPRDSSRGRLASRSSRLSGEQLALLQRELRFTS